MEEKKVVEMKISKNGQQQQSKTVKGSELSKEQLSIICAQLDTENRKLKAQLGEMAQYTYFKRLEFLFEVIKNYSMFDDAFISKVVSEIEDNIYPSDNRTDKEPADNEEPV